MLKHVADYPLYDSTAADAAASPEELLARYRAGYLVMTGPHDSAFRKMLGLPESIVLASRSRAPRESSQPGNPGYKPDLTCEPGGNDAVRGVPAPSAEPPHLVRTLYARDEDGQPAWQQIVTTDPSTIAARVDAWRPTLRSTLAAANLQSSDVNPDPGAWTLLGGKTVQVEGRGWFSPWYYNSDWAWWDTGTAQATFSLYRLNSKDAFDYFLVKSLWTVSPKNQRLDFGGIWFFNRDHKLNVQLSARTANGDVNGDLVNYEPKTVPSSESYDVKFGGDLNAKIAEKPEAGGTISAEIATTFTIPSVNTNATVHGPEVTWELQHDYGPGMGRGIGSNWPATTISGANGVTWALYRFSRNINDGKAPEMQLKVKLAGNFGSAAEKWWGLKQSLAFDYASHQTVLQYAVPTMSYAPVRSTQNPLEIAPGKSAAVRISAGAPGLPLQWQPSAIPKDKDGKEFLSVSPASVFLGDGDLHITAAHFAEPGTFGYLRVNSVPWTAADSLRQGGLDIPVRIVSG